VSRIRSVHPGLFTDEAFAGCSPLARLLWIGIWTEADDQGIFEWKPFGLRMRILPGDKVDGEPLLVELIASNMVRQFTHGGREYGAIRNFGRFQKPKKAKKVHPVPHELRTYVALNEEKTEPVNDEPTPVPPSSPPSPRSTPSSSPPLPPSPPTRGENPIQREEGGGRREDNLEAQRTSPASRREEFDKIEHACREALGESAPDNFVIGPIVALVDQGLALTSIVNVLLSEARRKRAKPIRTWKVWADIVNEKIAESPKLGQKSNGHAPPDGPTIDLGGGPWEEGYIVRLIEKQAEPSYASFLEREFGGIEYFRQKVAARAPNLMKFWPAAPLESAPAAPAPAVAR
jgi:hypothetical protein